ncbi:MAG: ATP-dependent zinc metalloprotease FtsH [Acidimicrobiales bacterium]|nr:ATP-dependent zinc metalloprotease FtsH [Acidimicrobiales bacterium]
MKRFRRSTFIWVAVLVAAVFIGGSFLRGGSDVEELDLNTFRDKVAAGEVETATIKDKDHQVEGELNDGTEYEASYPAEFADELTGELSAAEPSIEIDTDQQQESIWLSLLFSLLPLLILFGLFLFVINAMQGGGSRVMQFGKAKAKQFSKDQPKVTFDDVAGADEAVEELREIKDFLSDPSKFSAIGAKIPRGVLLVGPPGTGKTLLARAVAGEAGAPFFSISGSDFVEMFVGVGASRVRDLFNQAKEQAPAIVFVDEIDAVGRHRGAGMGGGHDEREQTLNQLLVEMDGFDAQTGVILIAATNRPDILDPALLRPGRFDRQIVVDRPDLEGRKAILDVHAKGKPLATDVDNTVIARRTPGFTGADLANLMNEAALMAARTSSEIIDMATVEGAIDRVLAGPERKTRVMSDKERNVTAYHEGGHALVGHVLEHCDPIHKVSIVARGRALGWTLALPREDRYTHTKSELIDRLAMLLGGRTAEEVVFGEITTGAADDIEKATEIARAMVTSYGMSSDVGPLALGNKQGEIFLGKEYGHEANYSDSVAATIDTEVRKLVSDAHERAEAILTAYRTTLDQLAREMLDKETLDDSDLERVFGDLDTWVDPDPSALDGEVVAEDDIAETSDGEAPTVVASERLDGEPAAPTGEPATVRRRPGLRRWFGLRPGPTGT